ncbi:MAG: DUF4404 family protein [Verrucomicrobia bacterium]|nr:DUF4404 family protein [Verrucomicrobiota bacterium]
MIENTIAKIENQIRNISSLNAAKKEELVSLLATLKQEVVTLAETESDRAESIARFTEISTHEATRQSGSDRLKTLSAEGLAASVDGFEASHPRLVQIVNNFCTTLANLGI